jgi:hypothetical protein
MGYQEWLGMFKLFTSRRSTPKFIHMVPVFTTALAEYTLALLTGNLNNVAGQFLSGVYGVGLEVAALVAVEVVAILATAVVSVRLSSLRVALASSSNNVQKLFMTKKHDSRNTRLRFGIQPIR